MSFQENLTQQRNWCHVYSATSLTPKGGTVPRAFGTIRGLSTKFLNYARLRWTVRRVANDSLVDRYYQSYSGPTEFQMSVMSRGVPDVPKRRRWMNLFALWQQQRQTLSCTGLQPRTRMDQWYHIHISPSVALCLVSMATRQCRINPCLAATLPR